MRSRIKWINLVAGNGPVYESMEEYDTTVEHDSYDQLLAAVQREGWVVVKMRQFDYDPITRNNYCSLSRDLKISVLYGPSDVSRPWQQSG
jgi:hypothetical protein